MAGRASEKLLFGIAARPAVRVPAVASLMYSCIHTPRKLQTNSWHPGVPKIELTAQQRPKAVDGRILEVQIKCSGPGLLEGVLQDVHVEQAEVRSQVGVFPLDIAPVLAVKGRLAAVRRPCAVLATTLSGFSKSMQRIAW